MRLVICADIHLGSSDHLGRINPETGLHSRLEDFLRNLDKVIDYTLDDKNKIDTIILAGDLFKSRHPTNIQQEEFGKRIARLSNAKKQTYILMGNHDILVSEGASHTAGMLKALAPTCIKVVDTPSVIGNIAFMPYIYRQRLGLKTNAEALGYYSNEVQKLKQQGGKIFIGHQSVEGAHMPSGFIDPELMSEIVVPKSILKDFEFCAFGHIHEYQVMNDNPVILYTGTIERIDFSQADKPCGFIVYDDTIKKHEFIEIEATDLYRIRVNLLDGKGDMTERILSAIDQKRLVNSITTLQIEVKEGDLGKINRAEIQNLLDKAKFCAGFKIETERESTSRNQEISETMSAEEALKQYIKSRDDLKDITDDLLKCGIDIIKLCDVNR